MSWLWIPILVVWIAAAVNGYRRGFLRIFLRFILTIVILAVLYPVIEAVLLDKTPVLQQIEEACTEVLSAAFDFGGELNRGGQISFIDKLPLLDFVKNDIAENNNSVIYELFSAETFYEYIVSYLAAMILKVLTFLLSLLATDIIVRVIVDVLDIFAKLPIIGSLNRIGGLLFGFVKGFVYLWIFFIAVTLFMGTEMGGYILGEIFNDPCLNYLYENNVLIQYIVSWMIR